ncbi:hypothetical protein DES44_2146 [Roseateles depolymerans]|uniref:Uncharacterized protein n=1 Tax=Roseateles depolymerans TaxID=76731 RepID=A0A0U3MDF3_9BURK|nr:hypothetical protein RD2015_2197 [Roseateles depolymerans]REG19646.1 hypothetical protein DES44_2146 [Roseateles depolymerans]
MKRRAYPFAPQVITCFRRRGPLELLRDLFQRLFNRSL